MIRVNTRAIAKLLDKFTPSPGDLSHLIEVRPLHQSEINIVADELNPARNVATHRGRLRLQDDGMLVYLIAWLADKPVGHAMLLWEGPTGSPKQHIDRVCPYVEDLWVRQNLRSRGVGARLIAEMAMMTIAQGYRSLSLSVGVDNHRAIELYERLGFARTRIPIFTLSGMVSMANGDTRFWSEECQYMLKSLDLREERELEIV